jgi:Xaa-Pro aminopeptidase
MISALVCTSILLGILAQSPPVAISAEEYRARREKVRQEIGPQTLFVLRGPDESHGGGPFRQDSNLYYLTGVEEPGIVLLLDPSGPQKEVLFLPERNLRRERWEGPRLYPGKEAERATGIRHTRPLSEYEGILKRRLSGKKTFYFNHRRVPPEKDVPGDLEIVRRIQERATVSGKDPLQLKHPRPILTALRQVKSSGEIALLRQAVAITGEGLREAMRSVEPGMYEYQAQAILEYVFKRNGSKRPGFSSIVGSGPNSCVLHYRKNDRKMESGDLLLMDVGAEYGHYTADITRTIPVSGKFTPRQREIYQIVLRAQEAAFEKVRPGSTVGAVHGAARKVIQKAGYGKHFLHSTSHWLGLDVHDPGVPGRKLEPGMVLTVEPGIYIVDENLGVRIEDDLLVTEEGYLHLSAGLPRDPDAIESIMAEGEY